MTRLRFSLAALVGALLLGCQDQQPEQVEPNVGLANRPPDRGGIDFQAPDGQEQ